MAPSLGVNLRVTGHCNQGGRKYMEDIFSVAYQQTDDEKDLEYAFFGIFDGHGGSEAAQFAKDNLMEFITKNSKFWSDDDQTVLKAIREGFMATQQAMWKDLPSWRKTASGLPSTAGTTASICFIKRGKLFVGHVGDSGIILGERDPHHPDRWRARRLTRDHKPECEPELSRIRLAGGKVVAKSGVPRVVWYRPSGGHQGPVRRSTTIDEVPFLAVARALGDLWSYNSKDDIYVVSPDPDLHVYDLNILKDRCLILGTDGAWNVLSPDMSVQCVHEAERNNERHMIDPHAGHTWLNPSKKLVDLGLQRWNMCKLRADNTSVVTVMLDPPGPPRAQVLRRQRGVGPVQNPTPIPAVTNPAPNKGHHQKGVTIISRYPNSQNDGEKHGTNLAEAKDNGDESSPLLPPRIVHDSMKPAPLKIKNISPKVTSTTPNVNGSSEKVQKSDDKVVQCNEISSSDDDEATTPPPPVPQRPQGGHNRPRRSLNREMAALVAENSGPCTRSRTPAAAAAAVTKRPLPPLPSSSKNYDSDAENNRPCSRARTRQMAVMKKACNSTPKLTGNRKKTPTLEETSSPRILRPRNTPSTASTTSVETGVKRKRRSFEPTNIAAKMLKTAVSSKTLWAHHHGSSGSKKARK